MKRAIFGLFNRLRFNQKLFLSYLIVIIIPILVLGVYAYNQSKQMLNYQAFQGIDKNVSTISESINNSIERYNHTIRSIVYNKTFQKIVANDYLDLVNLSGDLNNYLSPYFIMMMNLDKEIEKITFYTQSNVPEYGDSVVSYKRVENEPWYSEAVQGSENQWFYDKGLIVTAKFPKFFAERYTSIVYMRINDKSFFKSVTDISQDYGIVIADAQNRIIYANQSAMKTSTLDSREMMKLSEGLVRIGLTEMFLVKKMVPQTNWTLYCFVPAGQVSPNAGTIINATLIVILLCIVSLLVIISIFSKTMIRRIFRLNAMMKRVEMGELNLRVQSSSRDEIGELTNRFGNMLIRLNELIEESFRSKIVQKEAEMKALQWQINPHFLYNTLSFINWKALGSDAHDISYVVTSMSKFYRTALNRGNNIISVRDELENIKSYVEIIQVMGENNFDVVYEIDAAVYEYSTINLILQPLAENAIKHGINQKMSGRGLLQVSARLGKGTVEFAIEDNGPGMPQETIDTILTIQSVGYGLNNVNERLQLRFGAEYGIGIRSRIGHGTVMTVVIPQYMNVS
ncbi:HAMP domain-containing protein [Paenibacillus sp. LMG 31460]|uniref:histidine kinase n=1 Tax=Paenibacillus germinis TaxID=2654979 RepID=A0ABX1YUP4_9BACL|nr:sensor histidine kinase [Paenibacillus germinis]NOU84641.1 HAMP domain-containing protein [Paenibacillus germinis]